MINTWTAFEGVLKVELGWPWSSVKQFEGY